MYIEIGRDNRDYKEVHLQSCYLFLYQVNFLHNIRRSDRSIFIKFGVVIFLIFKSKTILYFNQILAAPQAQDPWSEPRARGTGQTLRRQR